jgi:hypothetical protein
MSNLPQVVVQNFRAADVPQFQEVIKNKDWVFYGEDNQFPNHLLALYQYSALNRACINAITYGINGQDLLVDGQSSLSLRANKFDSVYDVFKKCVVDRIVFGGYALNTVLSNDGSIAEFYHTDFSRIRAGKVDNFDNVKEYWYSADWSNLHKYKPMRIPSLDFSNTEDPSQIMYFKQYAPGMSYYPAPDYLGGVTTIQLDIEVKNFHLNNTQNAMNPSVAVSFSNGVPSEEERDIIQRQLDSKFTSTNNSGKFFLFFSENPETVPQITPIPNNASDGWYNNLYPQIENTILSSHRISSPMILGIRTAGQLGGRAEILDSYELFLETVIKPIQKQILTDFEKVLFLRDRKVYNLEIVQNKILNDPEVTTPQ